MENFKIITKCKKELANLYLISDAGRVFSLGKNKFLKGTTNGTGYQFVLLRKNNIRQKIYIHRLVALHFLDNKENKPFINHKDCDPSNNCVENLEWCTPKENSEYSKRLGHYIKTPEWKQKISDGKTKKSVISIDIITGEIQRFNSINETGKYGFQPSCVCQCCEGVRKKHKKRYWQYEKEIGKIGKDRTESVFDYDVCFDALFYMRLYACRYTRSFRRLSSDCVNGKRALSSTLQETPQKSNGRRLLCFGVKKDHAIRVRKNAYARRIYENHRSKLLIITGQQTPFFNIIIKLLENFIKSLDNIRQMVYNGNIK